MREKSLVCLTAAELASTFPNKIVTGYDRLWSIETGFLWFDFCRPIRILISRPNISFCSLTLPHHYSYSYDSPYKRKDKIIKTKIFLSNGLITKEITVLLTIVSYNLFLCFGAELSCETPIFKSPVKEISLSVVIFNDPYHEEISFILFK